MAREKKTLRLLKPLDPPMVPFIAGGMAVWAVLGLVLLGFRSTLERGGNENWIGICLAAFLIAIPGLGLMIVHDRNRARRRSSR